MKTTLVSIGLALLFCSNLAAADEYSDTIKIFQDAGESGKFFSNSHAYAIFPSVGKGGLGIGGAYGKGRVYVKGKYVGDATLTQLTAGLQAGGQSFSEIVFFQDTRAFDEFTSGNFEFGAQATAVAITSAASAGSTTAGNTAGVSGGKHDASTAGSYHKGMAIFTVAKGGLMLEATIGGQKFSYTPRHE